MPRNKPIKWTDGLKGIKTATNPKGGGRVKGRDYSFTNRYPGVTADHRLSWTRMKAQAKYRNEAWDLSWEQYQDIWMDKWHLKGRGSEDLCLTRIDWSGAWHIDNVNLVFRADHVRRQSRERSSKRGRKLGPRKPKV